MRPLLLLLAVAVAACDTTGVDGALITRYDGPRITEADATVPNPPFGPAGWDGSVFWSRTGQSVSVRRVVTCGDECARTLELVFSDAPPIVEGALPEAVTGSIEVVSGNPDGYERSVFEIERVQIQDWGPSVYSGVVHIKPYGFEYVEPIVFWADDLPVAAE